ncbi:hypothetical protein K435DRAFT_736340 [Dendrothele bispora CBS 962.96]|uniref:Tautomerase cis-CaaD-like domain-containing protein n=1 Tax=Dendrothele bispora (strain CBS 962.96) TaxID=1314807 RepID=A0A4S8KWD8_DENBC|nr:hypothetical protein K435DRAFT_736340 [Dendrothele bispora CBS 962.96]
MPFHRIYCSSKLYTSEEKQAMAKAILECYKRVPAFYVVVSFIDIEKDNFFVGGEIRDRFLRITVDHLARIMSSDEEKREWMEKYEKCIEPWTKDKGIDWEVTISNQDPVFWNQNGYQPPPMGSEPFEIWKKNNKPSPYKL